MPIYDRLAIEVLFFCLFVILVIIGDIKVSYISLTYESKINILHTNGQLLHLFGYSDVVEIHGLHV